MTRFGVQVEIARSIRWIMEEREPFLNIPIIPCIIESNLFENNKMFNRQVLKMVSVFVIVFTCFVAIA